MSGLVLLAACSSGGSDDADDGNGAPSTRDEPPEAPKPRAEITGPITGGASGEPANRMEPELADQYGYVEEEYFVTGDATAFVPVGELGTDGQWSVEPAGTAPYTTRVLVRLPADSADFNGIAVVEWFNVSSGMDGDPDFGLLHPLLLDEGYAHIAVSAQQAGVGDGARVDLPDEVNASGAQLAPLKQRDPERYGELSHPGDDYSYDIVTQVGELVRHGDLLDGVQPDHTLLTGESQSAARLTTYIDAVQPQPEAQVYDGFLVHSRNGSGAPLAGDEVFSELDGLHIRTDLDAPVLQFQTESDLTGLGFLPARQPDTDTVVTWEVAGTAHADATLDEYAQSAIGISFDVSNICGAINDGPQAAVFRAAFVALVDWVVDGTAPTTAPPFETDGDALSRDDLGIARSGVRSPAVDAPVAVLSGDNDVDNEVCELFGSTVPLTPGQLTERYPSHDDYVDAVTRSADAAVDGGFLLPDDRDAIVAEAEDAAVPSGQPGQPGQ